MKISYVCNRLHINGGWSPWDIRVGGSEEMIINTAAELQKRGHEVTVYHNGRHGDFNGVEYREHDDYQPGDITINVNRPEFRSEGKQILWTSLSTHPNLDNFEAVCCISEYAKSNTDIEHKNVFVIEPGYYPKEVDLTKKVSKQCLYASSPDRGLEVLLRAWPAVRRAHPDATLKVTYDAEEYDIEGVEFLQGIDEVRMDKLYAESDVWCHPNIGIELYGMAGVKAQSAGCVPVVIPAMALAETVRDGYFSDIENYATTLIKALDEPEKRAEIKNRLIKEEYPTWENATDKLLKVIHKVVK